MDDLGAKCDALRAFADAILLAHKCAALRRVIDEFDPNQPRESDGKWTEGAGSAKKGEWKKVGAQKGSNEGGVYERNGQKYYAKFYKNHAQGRQEVLAAKVAHNLLNVQTLKPEIISIEGKKSVASKWRDDVHSVPWASGAVKNLNKTQRMQLARMYYAAVLTKNWDVLGVDFANIGMTSDGELVQLDTGGAFEFRAQGKPKPYDSDVSELQNFLNPAYPSGKVFGELKKIDPAAFKEALFEVESMQSDEIDQTFGSVAGGAEKKATFLERRKKVIEAEKAKPKPPLQASSQKLKAPSPAVHAWPKKGEPGYKSTKERLREIIHKAHTVDGHEASKLVASVIKVPPPPLKAEYKSALSSYVSSSAGLNGTLRAAKGDLSGVPSHYKEQIENLDKMMNEARTYRLAIRLTRGIPADVVAGHKVGDTFTDHGYSSTSFAKAKAAQFGHSNTQLEVRLPYGFKFLSVPSYFAAVGKGGGLAFNEAEAILPRGTTFKIQKITTQGGYKVYHVDALSSSLQPPRAEWNRKFAGLQKTSKAAKAAKGMAA
jgi:hypothetical protein